MLKSFGWMLLCLFSLIYISGFFEQPFFRLPPIEKYAEAPPFCGEMLLLQTYHDLCSSPMFKDGLSFLKKNNDINECAGYKDSFSFWITKMDPSTGNIIINTNFRTFYLQRLAEGEYVSTKGDRILGHHERQSHGKCKICAFRHHFPPSDDASSDTFTEFCCHASDGVSTMKFTWRERPRCDEVHRYANFLVFGDFKFNHFDDIHKIYIPTNWVPQELHD